MPRATLFRTAAASWLLLATVVLWGDRGILRVAQYEQADDAANALSIDAARHGREIYGNYSRFIFRHPGPAFVYAYAAGELVLKEGLGLVSPRHNAHLLAGLLLQAAFLALAIGVAASHSSAPWRATGFLTGVALVHFACVPGAFTQIWPPLALIMPTALFAVAAASVATGRTGHAVWLALSAGFLLHGHVAQFLLVGGALLLVAGILAFGRLRGRPAESPTRAQGLALALIAALTVLPWVIDAARGRESNLFNIWLHVRQSAGDPLRPGWRVALADTASYFCYCTRQDDWFAPGATLTGLQFLRDQVLGILAALAGAAGCGWVLWREWGSPAAPAAFRRRLAGVVSVSFLLCVVWAHRQDGGITFFNSLFVFGLALAAWFIPVLALAEGAGAGISALVLAALAAAILASAGRFGERPAFMGPDTLGREAAAAVPRWLSGEAHPERAKLLQFGPDQWVEAVTVAAALNREGIRSYVPESEFGEWRVMFGDDHVIHSLEEARALGPFSWWRPAARDGIGGRLAKDLDDGSGRERMIFPFGFDVRNPRDSFGLSQPEDHGTWTESRVVLMRLWSEPARSDVTITFRASALPLRGGMSQRVRIVANGAALPEVLVADLADYATVVPRQSWNAGPAPGQVELQWGLPDATRPAAQPDTGSMDRRLLAICLHRIEFGLAPADPRQPRP